MGEKEIKAAIAGLVHDIGKLEQRARVDPWKPPEDAADTGQPVHAAWSARFIQSNLPARLQSAALAGVYHHQPDRSPAQDRTLSEVVALADKLSAGERSDLPDRSKHPPRQMVTIFDRLHLGAEARQPGWHYLPLKELRLERSHLFPGKEIAEGQEGDAYQSLLETLQSAVRREIPDDEAYLENLQGALQQAAWCVPSAYYHSIPDVALYDHARSTAALAACLISLEKDQINALLNAVQADFESKADSAQKTLIQQPAALLVGGDISGIQDFIYTISSKGAARTLRGRSFYLQLLTEAVLRYVLRRLGLPYTNVIFSGGGHFYLLAPLSAADLLADIRHAITRKLLTHHGASLYLAVGAVEVPACGFRSEFFPTYWGKMHAALTQAKQQRYTELDRDFYPLVFEPPEFGGNPADTCSVCGEDQRKTTPLYEDEQEPAAICSLCLSFADEIGTPLPSARFVALGFAEPQDTPPGTASDALRAFGMQVQLLHSVTQAVSLKGVERITLWALDDPDHGWPAAGETPTTHLLRYTVNRIPPMTFDKLAEKVEGGFEQLGVLRMDVDNLGLLFKEGFGKKGDPEQLASLSRIATLSFQMSLFFEGWVKRICEGPDFNGLIYAVYAGGDDVFLIGPWDRMPRLAQQIAADFNVYTAQHPAVHLSAGLAFIGGKYPVYQAADDAFETLSQAKRLPGKNAFSFLGQAFTWSDFSGIAQSQAQIEKIVSRPAEGEGEDNLEGPQAVIHILRQLASDESEAVGNMKNVRGRPVWGPWVWKGNYLLYRMAERCQKKKPELAQAIEAIRLKLQEENYATLNRWGIAARWTQLVVRKKQIKKV
jgi:CRISPR-associated protein Csm1